MCQKHYLRDWNEKNPGKGRESRKRWVEANPERHAAYSRKWRQDHKVRIAAALKEKNAALSVDERRDAEYRNKFGVTYAFVLGLLSAQGGRCAMCDCALVGTGKGRGLGVLDHCHETGRIRGILCGPCNTSLGHYEKVKQIADVYLARPETDAHEGD